MPDGPGCVPEVWDFVDCFVQQLQQAADVGRQVRATLDVIRASTTADAVLLYSSKKEEVSERIGPYSLDVGAACDLARTLVAKTGTTDAQLHALTLPSALGLGAGAGSAAVVRLSRTRGAWIIALRGPGVPLSVNELKLMTLARRLLVQQQQTQKNHDQLRDILFGTMRCLTAALDARDPYTCGHSERVARIAVRLAEQVGLGETARSEIYLGGLLHDIGKIGVSDEVLRKPGKLTDAEFDMIKWHTVIGDTIVAHVAPLAHIRPLVRNHHEQYDGLGYPDGMAGEEIPLGARVLAVADACDAMMSDRPYRKGIPRERIEQIFREGSGRQWDPRLIEAFFDCQEDIYPIYQRGLGDSVFQAVEHALRAGEGNLRGAPSVVGLRPSDQGLPVR